MWLGQGRLHKVGALEQGQGCKRSGCGRDGDSDWAVAGEPSGVDQFPSAGVRRLGRPLELEVFVGLTPHGVGRDSSQEASEPGHLCAIAP